MSSYDDKKKNLCKSEMRRVFIVKQHMHLKGNINLHLMQTMTINVAMDIETLKNVSNWNSIAGI